MPTPLDASASDLLTALREDTTRAGVVDPQVLAHRLYDELRALARGHRARWRGNETMNTTALVHEAYLKIVGGQAYEGDAHLLAVASRAMRQVLINYARGQSAAKRGGGLAPVSLDDAPPGALLSTDQATEVLSVEGALERLGEMDPRAAQVVEMKFFGGLTLEETAEALGVSTATVTRDWRRSRAWLRGELGELPTNTPTLI